MGVRVGVDVGRFVFDDVPGFRAWLDRCEGGGAVDSIWQSDRIVAIEPFHEPLAMLAVGAGATCRLKVGMNAVVLGFDINPLLQLARELGGGPPKAASTGLIAFAM